MDEWLEAYQLGGTVGYLSQYKSVYGAGIRLDFALAYGKSAFAVFEPHAIVTVDGRDRETALSLMRPFNMSADVGAMPKPVEASPPIKVFIGHGRAADWRELSEELHHVHKYEVEAFEYGSRAGLQITDIVESMVASSSFAVLILNPDDEQADGQRRARQNVIHELGLCQGRLGFRRVIPVIETSVEGISNLAGTKAIPYAPGTIKGTVSEILAALRREFPDHK